MKNRRILVIGGLAAGPSAAAKARRVNPKAEVTLFEASETVSYGLCEAPYAIGGLIPDESTLVAYTQERMRQEKGVDVKTLSRVESIEPLKKSITVRDLRLRSLASYEYDSLVVATGSLPRRIGLAGETERNVFHLSNREDTAAILKFIHEESPASAVIIGGGYIGMEMAEALKTRGLDVTMIHRHRLPMAGLEQDTRERILIELEANGVHFITNAKVEGFAFRVKGRVTDVVTNRGSFEADIIILSLGVEPNVSLARSARLRLGPTGAIAVDERQRTSVDGVYAAGDCCEVKNSVTGKPMYLPLATLASRAGWVAGENAAGGHASFKGAIRAIGVKVFGIEVAQVGISSEEARQAGFPVLTASVSSYGKIKAMPGSEKITIRLIFDAESKRVLGANVVGGNGSVLRANTLGVAIQHRMTIDDVARFDMIYSPPFAPLWDPILVAANQARKK